MKVSLFRLRLWLVVARVGLVAKGVLDLLCIWESIAFIGAVCALLHWMALWVCGRARKVLDAAGVENE